MLGKKDKKGRCCDKILVHLKKNWTYQGNLVGRPHCHLHNSILFGQADNLHELKKIKPSLVKRNIKQLGKIIVHPYQVVVHVNVVFVVNRNRGKKRIYVTNFKHSNKFNTNVRRGYI
jgi:hypothetical protein